MNNLRFRSPPLQWPHRQSFPAQVLALAAEDQRPGYRLEALAAWMRRALADGRVKSTTTGREVAAMLDADGRPDLARTALIEAAAHERWTGPTDDGDAHDDIR